MMLLCSNEAVKDVKAVETVIAKSHGATVFEPPRVSHYHYSTSHRVAQYY